MRLVIKSRKKNKDWYNMKNEKAQSIFGKAIYNGRGATVNLKSQMKLKLQLDLIWDDVEKNLNLLIKDTHLQIFSTAGTFNQCDQIVKYFISELLWNISYPEKSNDEL